MNYTISRPEHGYKLLHLPNYMPINVICYEGFTLMVVDNLNSLSDLDSQAIIIYRDTSPFYQTKDSKYSYFYKKITVDTLNKQVKQLKYSMSEVTANFYKDLNNQTKLHLNLLDSSFGVASFNTTSLTFKVKNMNGLNSSSTINFIKYDGSIKEVKISEIVDIASMFTDTSFLVEKKKILLIISISGLALVLLTILGLWWLKFESSNKDILDLIAQNNETSLLAN